MGTIRRTVLTDPGGVSRLMEVHQSLVLLWIMPRRRFLCSLSTHRCVFPKGRGYSIIGLMQPGGKTKGNRALLWRIKLVKLTGHDFDEMTPI